MDQELLFGELAFSDIESPKQVKELAKALTVGYEMGTTDQVGFGATRIESLEKTLKWVTAKEKSATFWKSLRKGKGESTVEEFASMNEIGDAGFYTEGGLPEEYDEDIKREFEQTKYIGAVGKVPNPARVIKSIVNNVAVVQRAKAISIMWHADYKSFFGNATNISTEWNGFLTQFLTRVKEPTQNVIDLAGKRLRPETLNDVSTIIQDNYGDPNNTQGWLSPQAFNDYTDELLKERRFFVGTSEARNLVAAAKSFEVGNGKGRMDTDIFLRYRGQHYNKQPHPKLNAAGSAFASTHAKAPNVLDGSTFTCTPGGSGGTIPAATYDYCAVPVNRFGQGQGFQVADVVVGAAEIVTFVLADNGSPTGQEATCFDIYRRLATSTDYKDYRYVKTIAVGAATKVDNGSDIPGTTTAFFWDWDFDQVLDFKQLLPMVKMPLAVIDDSIRWLQKLYGTPILYNANKMVVVKNIGSTAWS